MSTSLDAADSGSLDLNAAPLAGYSPAAGGKHPRAIHVSDLPAVRNLVDEMTPLAPDDPMYYDDNGHGYEEGFMANMINEGGQETQTHEVEVEEAMNIDEEPLFADDV